MFSSALLNIVIVATSYALATDYNEKFRAQFHYSPKKGWMNDPNGLVYYDEEYHLFYQYNKINNTLGRVWWGHAVSKDLIHWTNLPVALTPNKDGEAFSGSAIVDVDNSTGFQRGVEKAIVAIFTRDKDRMRETQHVWYSNDKGRTFNNYEGNPVLEDTNFPIDFRDPKVKKIGHDFVVAIAAGQQIRFYKSKNMKTWRFLSSFGLDPLQGTHRGVWECPDLISMTIDGQKKWVLIVNLNPGGPNVGSGTQYFIGRWNGSHFINENSPDKVMWIDYGPDNYAGVTYANSPRPDPIFLAWASNWDYGNLTIQSPWRGQMTLPRTLKLAKVNNEYRLKSYPIDEINKLVKRSEVTTPRSGDFESRLWHNLSNKTTNQNSGPSQGCEFTYDKSQFITRFELDLSSKPKRVSIGLKNSGNERLSIHWSEDNTIVIDRSRSGHILNPTFAKQIIGKRISRDNRMAVDIIYDLPVIEIFFDKGLTALTVLHFPHSPYNHIEVSSSTAVVKKCNMKHLGSIWH